MSLIYSCENKENEGAECYIKSENYTHIFSDGISKKQLVKLRRATDLRN
jgi:hypothetical protein